MSSITPLKTWLSSLSISIAITVTLWCGSCSGLMGMPHVLIVAVFSGFATFIPNIGAFLPLIPIAVFTLATAPRQPAHHGSRLTLLIQLLESNVLTPMVVKRQLSIPAAGMLVFQLVAALAFGLLGVLLAVPLLAVVITLVRELYSYNALGAPQKPGCKLSSVKRVSCSCPTFIPPVVVPSKAATEARFGSP